MGRQAGEVGRAAGTVRAEHRVLRPARRDRQPALEVVARRIQLDALRADEEVEHAPVLVADEKRRLQPERGHLAHTDVVEHRLEPDPEASGAPFEHGKMRALLRDAKAVEQRQAIGEERAAAAPFRSNVVHAQGGKTDGRGGAGESDEHRLSTPRVSAMPS